MISTEFFITALVVVLIPGTGVIYTVSMAIAHGRLAGLYAAAGCTAGILPHLLASILGLAAVMNASALAFHTLRYAGVAYLFYIAYATWQDRSAFAVVGGSAGVGLRGVAFKAFLLNILNPKLTLFFLAFLPQFIPSGSLQPLRASLILSGVFMLMTFVVFVAYGCLAHGFRRRVIESTGVQRCLRYTFVAAFVGLGAKLATSDR
jgi:threonine/homoserine/homoserine lactone efflux protein